MNAAKTLLNFVLAGTLLGILVASWAGPHFIGWYNETPLATQTMCNLPQVVRNVSSDLLTWQTIGAGIGAAAFLALGILFTLRGNRKAREQEAQTPPPAAPSQTAP
ncbi:hypothetical protein HUA74_27670 [Myxococcus sp. CA051A]|uniref:Uncharacterized protein n=1 Tax=Myxococcus llanfairpwllgwyngyllgogerychwyrndrobwllllantysiliogogogochensis TaxID=2590453 RepID=A0A540WLP3_9BACT|nr:MULTISPECIES: hypothetical protein [Myxococcus]NTX05352.1 hypothetical protein [Myxococcus sp. CA040A]NTX09979.1 hypothetical protein [Myxococcus sp. CA056]NTX40067.1 hypothetical protein [Myxococcus sp. CA033]NTX56997.1 hypothetical protein [Myxococcus sp. CA039A]NTX64441.1 hypothetical protein [Myxococcus sp. CA051A]